MLLFSRLRSTAIGFLPYSVQEQDEPIVPYVVAAIEEISRGSNMSAFRA
jgi:hypothetical protein